MAFKPGQSGNPNGRPKASKFLTQHIIAELGEIDPETKVTKARKLVIALIDAAMAGDVTAAREVFDRAEGKVTQTIAGDSENPLEILVGASASLDEKLDRVTRLLSIGTDKV